MKNFLLALILFLAVPFALAQHGGGHASGGHASGGHAGFNGGHAQVHAPAPAVHEHGGAGYSYSRGDVHGGARAHWNGGRFEDHYFVSHWGASNRFYWGGCTWYGPRFYPGSYFWYNGAYFTIVDQIPDYWDDGEVYVDYDDGYWLINPMYPGVRYAVTVRF